LSLAAALCLWRGASTFTLGTIALLGRFPFRARRRWGLRFGTLRCGGHWAFGSACFLLCLLCISHPNLCIVR
jgi:hypothetical protein